MRKQKDAPDINEVIRRRVRLLRQERGMSAQQLVDAMHLYGVTTTRSTLSNYENGLREDITFHEAVAMALAFEVTLVDLFSDSAADGFLTLGAETMPTRYLRFAMSGVPNRRVTFHQLGHIRALAAEIVKLSEQEMS